MTTGFSFRTLIASALMFATAVSVYASGGVDDHSTEQEPIGCGGQVMNDTDPAVALANTASRRPDVYKKMLERRSFSPLMKRTVDDFEWEFNVWNRVTSTYDRITAVQKYEGKYSRIWVDKEVTNVTPAVIAQLGKALDSTTPAGSRNPNQGIIQNDVDVFGPIPLNGTFQDRKIDFLLTDIKDNTVGASVLGFFYRVDLDPSDAASNNMNILYIDSKEGLQRGVTSVLSTLAHEFQHLLHYTRNKSSQLLYNEGCSEDASLLNGYQDRGNSQYMGNTNVDMFDWRDGAVVTADYERAMTFTHYLRDQFGEQFLDKLVGENSFGINRVDRALAKMGLQNPPSSATILENFAVANCLRSNANPVFGYLTPIKSGGTPRIAKTFTVSNFPSDTSYSLERLGALYLTFNNTNKVASGFRVRFSGSQKFAVMAMLYRNNGVEVKRFAPDQEFYIGDERPYDKAVLAVVNTAETQHVVTMRVQGTTLAVKEDAAAAAAAFGLSNAPNPFNGSTLLRFNTQTAGDVTLKIYDSRGQEVATLVDGERFEAGSHQLRFDAADLPNGYYVARIWQGDRAATSSLVLMR